MQERFEAIAGALLRTVAFFDVMDYAPTWSELCAWVEWHGTEGFPAIGGCAFGAEQQAPPHAEELVQVRDTLVAEGKLAYAVGRVALAGRLEALATIALDRTGLFARKLRKARRVASWLARLSSVRFVGVVNTTSLAHARDASDIDFFVIVRDGSMWSTRAIGGGPYRLLGKLAGDAGKPDAICLSYFISDAALALDTHMLPEDDPYFRYWFLSLLPLYDDGIGRELWEANKGATALHPRAMPWFPSPDLRITAPRLRLPLLSFLEARMKKMQMSWFPQRIKERMNTDTAVLVSDQVLKFHVDDARLRYRDAYQERLRTLGLLM